MRQSLRVTAVGVMEADEMGQPSPALQSETISHWPPGVGYRRKVCVLKEIPTLDKEESEGAFFEEKCGSFVYHDTEVSEEGKKMFKEGVRRKWEKESGKNHMAALE